MRVKIRKNVFETNSSSAHAFTVLVDEIKNSSELDEYLLKEVDKNIFSLPPRQGSSIVVPEKEKYFLLGLFLSLYDWLRKNPPALMKYKNFVVGGRYSFVTPVDSKEEMRRLLDGEKVLVGFTDVTDDVFSLGNARDIVASLPLGEEKKKTFFLLVNPWYEDDDVESLAKKLFGEEALVLQSFCH